jgi:hypothetical protein
LNSLCEAILNDIDSINNECYDAQNAVTEAVIELEEKYIEMGTLARNNGFIQEGKLNDWLDPKENESIIRTILLAIPRIIRALVRTIRELWRKYSIHKKCEKIKDRIDEVDKLLKKVLDLEDDKQNIWKNTPPGLSFANNTAYIASRITNIHIIETYYHNMKEMFIGYATALQNGPDELMSNYTYMHRSSLEILKTITSSLDDGRKYDMAINSNDHAELMNIVNFEKEHGKILDEINKAMDDLNSWVGQTINSTDGKPKSKKIFTSNSDKNDVTITKDMANRLLEDARKLHDEFINTDMQVFNAVIETINNMIAIYNYIPAAYAAQENIEKQQLATADEHDAKKKKLEEEHPEVKDYDPGYKSPFSK